jgi:predicted glycosyltransferase
MPGSNSLKNNSENITWHNYLHDDELKEILLHSEKIICRSGYSTIMDLIRLNKGALLIPTPGQTEQEYLAYYNSGRNNFSTMTQEKFKKQNLAECLAQKEKQITVY